MRVGSRADRLAANRWTYLFDQDAFLGVLQDAMGQAPGGGGTVEAPIAGYPDFEHLEAEVQRLLPEQLKTMLMALTRSSLLRGDPR